MITGPAALALASLPRRAVAFGLDYLLIAAYLVVLVGFGLLVQFAVPGLAGALFHSALAGEVTGFVLLTLPVILYFALGEASETGGTWGKRRLGLRVLSTDGQRLGVARSLVRSGLKFLPWELAHASIWQFRFAGASALLPNLGLALVWALVALNLLSALLDGQRRALYDRVAGTVVVSIGR